MTPTPVDPAAPSGPVDRVAECEALRAEVERLRDTVTIYKAEARGALALRDEARAQLAAVEARFEAVQARADTAEARISAAFGVIGETGCFCVDDPPEEDCPNHRIEAALLGTWTEAEVADVKRWARELAERLRPHFEDAPLPAAALASSPEPEAEGPEDALGLNEDARQIIDELRDLWQRALEREGNLASAVADVVWKATQYGTTEDGDTAAYLVPKGTMHRLVGVAQSNGAHVSVSFRVSNAPDNQPVPPTEPGEQATSCGHGNTRAHHFGPRPASRPSQYDCPGPVPAAPEEGK